MKQTSNMRIGKLLLVTLSLIGISILSSCKEKKENKSMKEAVEEKMMKKVKPPFFKLSLAQWSIHKMIRNEGLSPYEFAAMAKSWGFEGLEYVSGLYYPELEKDNFSEEAMQKFIDKCNTEAQKHGLENVLIMVDGQGDLAAEDQGERNTAVQNHFKWVDAAAKMGCHSIRVNLNGTQVPELWLTASVDGLTQLSQYAKDKNINILVENHGGPSSNGKWLVEVIQQVNMSNCATLPDFGNFCIKRADGDYYNSECVENYDMYKGVAELMPFAKAVSAKSYDFDENGNETKIDYKRMLKIVKANNYSGYIGVEYEGSGLKELDGIMATKKLLLNAAGSL